MLSDEVEQTLDELRRVYELNVELLENLRASVMWIAQYLQETGTPVPRLDTLQQLMREASRLADEIGSPLVPRHTFIKPLKRDVTKSKQNDADGWSEKGSSGFSLVLIPDFQFDHSTFHCTVLFASPILPDRSSFSNWRMYSTASPNDCVR